MSTFHFLEIAIYCKDDPTKKVANSELDGTPSTELGGTALLNCKKGFDSTETQPITATCVELTDNEGQWDVNADCKGL